MKAWSTIVASGPCLMVNLSAERGKQVLPNRRPIVVVARLVLRQRRIAAWVICGQWHGHACATI
jgi:hypothetical protein